ncbi:unnamed protein product [Bursaphelenchus okinawaensis]|uniref:Uncharacterized protein n=1 Tax=Bursaphelenchus okinawaensis TaxID=465554 RepID=A0A811JTJ8_9BILA|nr:unnamed protein product [Bursaphelenchus okinawaensis]CAG9081946.1 unnamed protein product [Bursaphelenchus okinawaensis]
MWLLWLLPLVAAYPGLYTSKCLSGCRCNSNTIECLNLQNRNASFLREISEITHPNLEYLFITGAEFLDLPEKNVFGIYTHKKLRHVNFTDCRITSIGANSFSGMPNLEFLYISQNPIREVSIHALGNLKRLEYIDLSDVFNAERLNNAKVIKDIFSVDLPRLQSVYLRGNNIRDNIGGVFCHFPNLLTLDLSENRLTEFSMPKDCNSRLSQLNLAHNDFTSFPEGFDRLRQLDLHNNPLDCSSIKQYSDRLKTLERINATYCETPSELNGLSLDTVIAMEKQTSSLVKLLITVSAVVVIVIMIGLLFHVAKCKRNSSQKDIRYNLVQMQEHALEPEFL